MQRMSEMTIERAEEVLRGLDWREIHKTRVFSDYGASVVIYTDGETSVQDQGTYYRDSDAAGVLCYLDCWGNNIDTLQYTEGWTRDELDEDGIQTGNYVIDYGYDDVGNGKVLTEREVIERAIEEGEWDDDAEIEALLERIGQESEYLRQYYEERESERQQAELERRYYESFSE